MSVDSYTTLIAEIPNYVDEVFTSADIDTFVDLAEDRINRDLRIPAMETALNVTLSGGVAAIPSGFRELKTAYIDGNPTRPLEMRPLDWIHTYHPHRASQSKPSFIGIDGTNFVFGPYPDSDYTLKGTYYKAFDPLSGSNETNWLTDNAKGFLLYACLIYASEFTRDERGERLWASKYDRELNRIKEETKRYRLASGMPLYASAG